MLGWMAPIASTALWDYEGMHAICMRQVQLVRDAGAVAELPIYLAHRLVDAATDLAA